MASSPKYSLNTIDWHKILRGFLVAVGGAGVLYGAQFLLDVDFGAYQPIAVALSSVLINIARKYLAN